MKTINTFSRTAIFIIMIAFTANAQKVGTSSLQFLKVMPTARATAMGDAFVASAWGVDGLYWNPGALMGVVDQEITSTMTLWLLDTKQSHLGYARSFGNLGVFGVQFEYVDYGEIEETRVDQLQFIGSGSDAHYNPGLTGRTFSPKAFAFGVSYAKSLTENFSTGLTLKYVRENLFSESEVTIANPLGGVETYKTYTNTVLIDFGMLYDTKYRSIKLGVAVQNFGSSVKFGSQSFPAPLAFRLGTAFNVIGTEAVFFQNESNRLTLGYDIFQPNDYAQQMHFGAEYSFMEMFSIRGGYKMNYDNEKFSFGCGVQKDFAGVMFAFDYSYAGMGDLLGNVHRISLGVKL